MRRYRLLAALAAGVIAVAGVLTVTAGGTPPPPPPVMLREGLDTTPTLTSDEMEVVKPTVVELGPTTTSAAGTSPDDPGASGSGVESADTADEVPDSANSSVAVDDETPDVGSADADSPDESDSVASADSPDD